jgi:hypothetical protein
MTTALDRFLHLLRLALLCLIFYGNASAQGQDFPFIEPQFERVSDADTLDGNTVTALAQDARGLIWIGTQNGLVRYDGYRFRKFSHQINEPFSPSHKLAMVRFGQAHSNMAWCANSLAAPLGCQFPARQIVKWDTYSLPAMAVSGRAQLRVWRVGKQN